MIVIGLTGYAGAGKDTVADILVEKHGFQKRSLAGPLKEMLKKLNPILGQDVMNPGSTVTVNEALDYRGELGVKAVYPEYRRLLQVLGTDCIRAIDPEFWIKAAEKGLEELADQDSNAKVVFTDVRFPNEARMIHRQFGTVWQIQRDSAEPEGEVHESEKWVGRMGEMVLITNNGTVEGLSGKVNWLMGRRSGVAA